MACSEKFSWRIITGITVEKKLIGTDCAIYKLNSAGNFFQLSSFMSWDNKNKPQPGKNVYGMEGGGDWKLEVGG